MNAQQRIYRVEANSERSLGSNQPRLVRKTHLTARSTCTTRQVTMRTQSRLREGWQHRSRIDHMGPNNDQTRIRQIHLAFKNRTFANAVLAIAIASARGGVTMFRIEIRRGRWPGLCIVMAATARCCSNTFIASHFRLARKATQGAHQQVDDQQSDEERGFHTSKSTNAQLSEQPESGRSQAFDRLRERRLTRQPHAHALGRALLPVSH